MLRKKTILLRATATVAGLAFVLLLIGIAESYYERFQAQRLISVLSNIQVGITSESQTKELTKQFSRYHVHFDQNQVRTDSDQYGFTNPAFQRLHLAPVTDIWITIDYREGMAVGKTFESFTAPRHGISVVEVVKHGDAFLRKVAPPGRIVTVSGYETSPRFILWIEDDASVPLSQRQKDWQIDLSCMTEIGGCQDPNKLVRYASKEAASHRN
ncbi:hypothetical protein [Granulicella mallensis]|uniref:Uncharacterized protein n=1 Tax=Granulicella mallensis TaxID=940614 RepID=A0A7W7ZVY2_9BACT|nr:hypothetical protein [Granulicella mallensis]MBB5066703.1 hypothetical protein [Granulicella mallensis]